MFQRHLVQYLTIAALLIALVEPSSAQTSKPPQLGKDSLKEIVAAMTTEEKVKLLVGMGFNANIPGLPTPPDETELPEKVTGAAGRTQAIPRLGIPSLTLSDGPAGVRIDPIRGGDTTKTFYATGFPIATLLASSWDPDLVSRVGAAMGEEVRDYGIDVLLAPAMNIHRNPLGGRNFEYYSEDPLIAGKMAAAFVRGIQSKGVGTSVKHFAVNSQEFNRMQSNSILSERALREIYLRGFEIAVREGQPWTVMSSYNLINGTYASQSRDLLTTILRDEWGFKGLVMSDWFGGNNAVEQMRAGNDLLMPGIAEQYKAIINAVKDGSLSKQILDQNVERVLNVVLQSPSFKKFSYSEKPDLGAHATVGREAATEGMVLLQNNNATLPFSNSNKVALFGNSSYDLIAGGTGSGDVNKKYVVPLSQGLARAGYKIDKELETNYLQFIVDRQSKRPKPAPFMMPAPIPEMPLDDDQLEKLAAETNIAVFTLGRNSGEFADRNVDNDFTLSVEERKLLDDVTKVFHAKGKKVVVVLNIGGPIEVASWRSSVDAILLAWQPGQEGGNSIVDVLSGKVNPSGRLATTFPMKYDDVPSAKTFPGKELPGATPLTHNPFAGKPAEAIYDEGIYVGYRYYNTLKVEPAYPFGFGLSYTTFSHSDVKPSTSKFVDRVTVSTVVANTGKVPGKEVVQLYVSAPKQKLPKPAEELRAFAKTKLLKPGESETVTFTLTARDLTSFDPGKTSWVAEAGEYVIKVSNSAEDSGSTAKVTLAKEVVVQKSQKLLAPTTAITEIAPK